MRIIEKIDLWTEPFVNQYDCFNGAFSDGLENGGLPYDSYKIVKNCNCYIANNKDIPIGNKHQAIVFYLNKKPVRLLVAADKNTNLQKCVDNALNQSLGNFSVGEILKKQGVSSFEIDLKQKATLNKFNGRTEVDVCSCDRLSLLKNMLSGSYTDDKSSYGHFDSTRYFFDSNVIVNYKLETDCEVFDIQHECAFINDLQTRAIIIQKHMWNIC